MNLYTFESYGVADCVKGYASALAYILETEITQRGELTELLTKGKQSLQLLVGWDHLEDYVSSQTLRELPVLSWHLRLNLAVRPTSSGGNVVGLTPKDLRLVQKTLPYDDEPTTLNAVRKAEITINICIPRSDCKEVSYIAAHVKKQALSVLGHEIHHLYDMQKVFQTKNRLPHNYTLNAIISQVQENHPKLYYLFHPIYLALDHELNARVSQFYHEAQEQPSLSKEAFTTYLKKSAAYHKYLTMKSFTQEDYEKIIINNNLHQQAYSCLAEYNELIAQSPRLREHFGELHTLDAFFAFYTRWVQQKASGYLRKLYQVYPRLQADN